VVDDASTDRTAEVVQSIDDARIRYLRQEYNKGGAVARNRGLEEARGSYIAFQDSDDLWLPDKLRRQMERFAEAPESVGFVYCAYRRAGRNSEVFPPADQSPLEGDLRTAVLRRSFIGTPTLVVRSSCFAEVGTFDERLPRYQDWELVIRLARRYEASYVDAVLVEAGWADNNITAGHDEALLQAETLILQKHREAFEQAELLGQRNRRLAHFLFMQGKMKAGRERLAEAFRAGRRLDSSILWLLSVSPALYASCYRGWNRLRR